METPLRKKQRKILIKKVEVLLAQKLEDMVQSTWTKLEIAAKYGIPSSRQSEMSDPEKYPTGGLNERLLSKAIMGGLITVTEIKANVELSEAERVHIDTLAVLEHAAAIRRQGFDPASILEQWLKKNADK
jgi:hypothetical protein